MMEKKRREGEYLVCRLTVQPIGSMPRDGGGKRIGQVSGEFNPVEGAAIWMQYLTAYGLIEIGKMQQGNHGCGETIAVAKWRTGPVRAISSLFRPSRR